MAQEELKIAGMKLKIDGAAQFQSDLSLCTKESSKLKLDLKLLEAQTTSAGKNGVEFLREKSVNLTNQIVSQQEKTKLLNAALTELKSGAEVDAKQVSKLESEIYKSQVTTAELTKALGNNKEALAKVENQSLVTGNKLKEMGEKAKKAGEKLSSVGSGMTMMLTAPIAAAGAAAVKLASDYNESLNKVDVAYKDNAKEVIAWSNTTLKQIGLAKGTSLDMAATYGDMATGMGFATDASAKMGTSLVERAADLASFKNISIDIANTALTSVFTGETESLKKLGVVMTEANLISYMQAEGYTKTYKELTQAEKVTLRYQYVMDSTSNSAGDFARTIDGTANQSRLFTESLKELGSTFGEEILPVLTPIIKGAGEMIRSFGDLDEGTKKIIIVTALAVAAAGPLLSIVGQGISIYGTYTTALGVHTIATQALTKAEVEATGAGATMAASLGPILLVTAAVAGGIAIAAQAKTEYDAATEASREMASACKETADAFAKQSTSTDDSLIVTKQLSDELYSLQGKENKSNIEKTRMATIVKQLNDLMPDLSLSIDEQTGSLNKNKTATDQLIESKYKQQKLQESQDRQLELYSQGVEITNKLSKAQEELAAATDKTNKAADGYTFADLFNPNKGIDLSKSADDVALLSKNVDDLSTELSGNDAAMQAEKDACAKWAGAVTDANGSVDDSATESAKSVTTAVALTAEELKAQADAAAEAVKTQNDTIKQFYSDLEAAKNKHLEEMGAIDKKGIEQNKITADEVRENLEKQIEDFKTWRAGIVELSSRVPSDVMGALEELGPAYTGLIDDLNKMTDEELQAWVDTWREKGDLAEQAAEGTRDTLQGVFVGMHNTFYGLGVDAINGLIEGMNSRGDKATAQAQYDAARIEQTYRKTLDSHSPSRKMMKVGGDVIDGVIVGMKNKSELLERETNKSANGIIDGFSISPVVSLGTLATNRAMSASSSQSSSVSNSTVDASTVVNMSGAVFNVRSESDIDQIATALAAKVASSRKAVGA